MADLDSLDRRLIAQLRADGRAPISKLANILGTSRATAQHRLDRLLESGTILGFTVRAQDETQSKLVRAVMLIEVAGKSTSQVISLLRGFPEIYGLHTTNGSWDLVAQIQAETLPDFDRILREIRMTEGVLNSETSILLRSIE